MNNELYHYGIPGMKWYIRRYQNPDGTLTDKGKARYGTSEKKLVRWNRFIDRQDQKWYAKKGAKLQAKADAASRKEANKYAKKVLEPKYKKAIKKGLKTGDVSNSKRYAFEYNEKLAELMTQKLSNKTSVSGKTIAFVAKASNYEIGNSAIFMNLVWQGQQSVAEAFKNGVREDGRAARTKTQIGITAVDTEKKKGRA